MWIVLKQMFIFKTHRSWKHNLQRSCLDSKEKRSFRSIYQTNIYLSLNLHQVKQNIRALPISKPISSWNRNWNAIFCASNISYGKLNPIINMQLKASRIKIYDKAYYNDEKTSTRIPPHKNLYIVGVIYQYRLVIHCRRKAPHLCQTNVNWP